MFGNSRSDSGSTSLNTGDGIGEDKRFFVREGVEEGLGEVRLGGGEGEVGIGGLEEMN